jgi:hypothetical protein
MVVVSELPDGHLEAYQRWVDEMRSRRAAVGAALAAAGFHAVSTWLSPEHQVVVTRAEAPSLVRAGQHLISSGGPFEQWFGECEMRLLGTRPLDPDAGAAELVVEAHADDVDPLDLFIATPVPLLPDRVEAFRSTVALGDRLPLALERLRRWGLARFDIWMQATPRATWVVYDAAGDLAHMLRDISTSPDEEMRSQREFVLDSFGVDLSRDALAMPRAAWSWTA